MKTKDLRAKPGQPGLFDEPESAPESKFIQPSVTVVPVLRKPGSKWGWEFSDPWPENLPRREQWKRQILRDLRTLEEEEDLSEWELDFYADRIVGFRKLLESGADF